MLLIQQGNEPAFNTLYHRYATRLYGFLIKMLGYDTAKAQDVLQDIFLIIAEHPEKFDIQKKFSTWIFTIAANKCKNEYRNQINRDCILQSIKSVSDTAAVAQYSNHDLQLFRERLYDSWTQ